MLNFLSSMTMYLYALARHTFSQSSVPIVSWLMSLNWLGMNYLVPVLTVLNSVSAFPGKLCSNYLLPCVALLVGLAVCHKYFVPPLFILPFLRWQSLSSVINDLGGIRSWTWFMYWDRWIFVSTIEFLRLIWLSVPKVWSLLTPLLRWKWYDLTQVWFFAAFLVYRLIILGVLWGRMAP